MAKKRNEGEGNRAAVRAFNAAQRRFVKSGRVEEAARAAESVASGPDNEALRKAEETVRPKYGSVTGSPARPSAP